MGKSIFILSDLHLGAPDFEKSLQREKKVIRFLDGIKHKAEKIILLGDIFDYWFEYKNVVPKGFVRFLGKLAELSDAGIPIILFTGNHDIHYGDLFPKELNIKVFTSHQTMEFFGRKYFFAHGDGLGPGDRGYKLLKSFLRSRFARWLIRWIHPEIGVPLALIFSRTSRTINEKHKEEFLGDKEYLVGFVKEHAPKNTDIHAYVFGHRHIAKELIINNKKVYFIGDWILLFTYLEITQEGEFLKYYVEEEEGKRA